MRAVVLLLLTLSFLNKSGYTAGARICGVENYFRIGWELEDFHVEGKTTQITQFVITNQGWLRNNMSCILPQYSLPLIRSSGGTEGVEVTCAIRLSLCCQIEAVVIFGLTQLFCEYNDERKTCGRKIIDNDTIIYSTTIYNEPENKYYPEQYVFCNSVGSYLSIRIIRDTDLRDDDESSSSSSTTADVMHSQTPATEIGPYTSESPTEPCSNGTEDNTVTLVDNCTVIQALLPEHATKLFLDEDAYDNVNGVFISPVDNYLRISSSQERYGSKYRIKAKFCSPRAYFRIAWEMANFRSTGRRFELGGDGESALITQFITPGGSWSRSRGECIQPQYSLPLLRYSNESATVNVECAIRLPMCENSEDVVIYGLKETFCEYNPDIKTCERRVVDNEVIIYSTKIEKDVNTNKYHPDQYIFCDAPGSHMSMQIVWGYGPPRRCPDLHDDEEASSPASTTAEVMQSQTSTTETDMHHDENDEEETSSPSSTTAYMMQSQTPTAETGLPDVEQETSSSPSTTSDMSHSQLPTTETDLHHVDEEETTSPTSTTADMMQSQTPTTEIGPYTSESPTEPCSNGTEDNTVTLVDNCTVIQALLPEHATKLFLDEETYFYENGDFISRGDNYLRISSSQERYGSKYRIKAKFCSPRAYFRIAWELANFRSTGRRPELGGDGESALITQFITPGGSWSGSRGECIQPQYSLPLLRYSNESATVNVECAIRLPMCENSEDVVIYGLKETFCEYNPDIKTCERRVVDNEVIIYSTKIEKDVNTNKYHPDQYIFCDAPGSHMSMQIVWGYGPPRRCPDLHDDEEASSSASTTAEVMQSQTSTTEIGIHTVFLPLFVFI
ncbi:hypothetical protein AAHC03_022865 [Spirometra sp. Aus1]